MSGFEPFKDGNDSSSRFKDRQSKLQSSSNSSALHQFIGRGDDAKNSVIWRLINAILFIYGASIILLIINDLYHNKGVNSLKIIKDTWDTFTPLLTLSLGYMFGKREEEKSK